MTRMLWSKTLLCVHHKNPVLLLFLCSSSIAMFTAGFYITVWYRSERQEQDIVPREFFAPFDIYETLLQVHVILFCFISFRKTITPKTRSFSIVFLLIYIVAYSESRLIYVSELCFRRKILKTFKVYLSLRIKHYNT